MTVNMVLKTPILYEKACRIHAVFQVETAGSGVEWVEMGDVGLMIGTQTLVCTSSSFENGIGECMVADCSNAGLTFDGQLKSARIKFTLKNATEVPSTSRDIRLNQTVCITGGTVWGCATGAPLRVGDTYSVILQSSEFAAFWSVSV
jgi:hypothetical protein